MTGSDALFIRVLAVLVALALMYGAGIMIVVLVIDPGDDVVTRAIAGFGTIFAGLLGLCSGYLIGKRNNGNGG